jgi:uncharacterized protein (UPF0335 family)
MKKEVAFDADVVKEFITRLFAIEKEMKVLQEDKKELKEEFKGKIDNKQIANAIKLVKAQIALSQTSPETTEELTEIIKDKIGDIIC